MLVPAKKSGDRLYHLKQIENIFIENVDIANRCLRQREAIKRYVTQIKNVLTNIKRR